MGSSCTKAAPQEKVAQEKVAPQPPVGDVVFFYYDVGVIGTITEVMKGDIVKFQSPGPNGKIHEEKWEKGAVKVDTVPELNELLIVDGKMSGAVTVNFRGEDCKGWIVEYVQNPFFPHKTRFVVKFRPDDDHKAFDDTDFDMGESETVLIGKIDTITKGHTAGAVERPRVRNAKEIAEREAQFDKAHFASGNLEITGYMYCGGCGRGVWESPCDCYPTQKRKGYFCQACAREYDSGDVVCCKKELNKQLQNVGWAKIFKEKYGPLK